MILTGILSMILLFCIGFLFAEGMWSNALRFITVVAAALLATNYFEPVADQLDAWMPSYTYCWDFVALWGLFAVFVVLFRAITDQLSKVKVRFPAKIDRVGSVVFSALVGWVMVCFTLATLHTAPLGEKFCFGCFQYDQPMFLGFVSPDREWLSFVNRTCTGALCRSAGEARQKPPFDLKFLEKYKDIRKDVEAHVNKTSSIRLGEGEKRPIYLTLPDTPAATK